MSYLMNIGGNQKVTYHDWVNKHMEDDARAELRDALSAYGGPVSLENFQKDFGNLSKEDRLAFINNIKEGINAAHAAMTDSEFGFALQEEQDRRDREATDAAWAKSVADAKARAEAARREVLS